jgi:hypothetical protein
MMDVSRRYLVGIGFAGIVAAPLGLHGIGWKLRDVLERNFPSHLLTSREVDLFIDDVSDFWTAEVQPSQRFAARFRWAVSDITPFQMADPMDLESMTVDLFVRSTNVIAALANESELVYLGWPDPYANPCANPLGANWL